MNMSHFRSGGHMNLGHFPVFPSNDAKRKQNDWKVYPKNVDFVDGSGSATSE